jgi:hypothetical protein
VGPGFLQLEDKKVKVAGKSSEVVGKMKKVAGKLSEVAQNPKKSHAKAWFKRNISKN